MKKKYILMDLFKAPILHDKILFCRYISISSRPTLIFDILNDFPLLVILSHNNF